MSGKTKAAKKAIRKKRVPLGVPRLKLQFEGRPGYKRRVVNDVGSRIQDAIAGGYTLVSKDGAAFKDEDVANRNESVGNSIGKTVNSDGTKAYLMEIPITMYNADQAAKQESIDKTEDAIRQGGDSQGGQPGVDGRYIPREGIKIG